MAFSFISSVTAGGTTNGVTTGAVDTTGADFLVAVIANFTASSAPTITSEGGASANTWDVLTWQAGGGAEAVRIVFTSNYPANTNANHTFTVSNVSGFPSVTVFAFSGVKSSSPFDSENESATFSPGGLSPSINNSLTVLGLAFTGSSTPTADGGFILPSPYTTDYLAGNHFGVAAGYLIQANTDLIDPTWTASGASTGASAMAVFKPEVSSGVTIKLLATLGVGG